MNKINRLIRKMCIISLAACMFAGVGAAISGSYITEGIVANAVEVDDVAIVESGKCGDNVNYTLDSNGTLTINGTGDMYNYSYNDHSPFFCNNNVNEVIIEDGITSIGGCAFWYCISLTSISIPNSVESIGGGAFSGCCSLTSIDVSKDNSTYASKDGVLFSKDLKELICCPVGKSGIYEIPNSVTSIGEDAFSGCSSLTGIEIPNSVESIGSSAFDSCISLTNIEIPNSVTSIGNYAFSGCSSLTSIEIPNSVTSIGKGAFEGCSSLTNIEIPNSVTSIGNRAFEYCSSLTSVEIPNSVESIGSSAFYGCRSLTGIEIPNSVTSIGDDAFKYCSSLTSVEIPNSVTSIGNYAFDGCSSLTSVEIPNSVESIGKFAFYGCSSLTSVEIPNSVTNIGSWAFYGCSSLTSINIPESVTSIGYNAFRGCSSLTSIDVSKDNSTYASKDGVLFSKDLKELICCPVGKSGIYEIPNSVTSIGDRAFEYCSSLTSVEIPNSVESIGSSFYGCSSLTSIEIPNSVEIIGNYAFYGCSSLTSIEIPNSVTWIGEDAFEYCSSLTSVEIPNSVESIEWYAFYGCDNLTIYGYKDTYAETYAKNNDIPFVGYENTSSVSSESIYLGDTLTLNGSAIGGKAQYQYAYYYKRSNSKTWITAKSMSSETSVSIKPLVATDYDILIKVKDADGKVVSKKFVVKVNKRPTLVNNSSVSAASITLGDALTLNGSATGGNDGSYQYAYYYKRSTSGTWTTAKSMSSETSVSIKPLVATNYDILIKVKDADGKVVSKKFTVTVKANTALTNNSSVSSTSIKLGDTLTLNGSATGGNDGSYQYAYYYKRSNSNTWTTAKALSNATSVNIKPLAATDYDILIKVKDADGKVVSKKFTVTVKKNQALVNNSSVSAASITLGETLTLNGSATGGNAPYQYVYYYKRKTSSTWVTAKSISNTTSVSIKPLAATDYDILIKVKDADGKIISKKFTVKVTK